MKSNKLLILPVVLTTITLLSGIILSSTLTHADGNTSVVDELDITVNSACTIKGGPNGTDDSGSSTYTTTINAGNYTELPGSKLVTLCNDPAGYAIYAIGYSGDSYDSETHTDLIGTASTGNIQTGTSGSNSYWAMKLEAVQGLTPPSIVTDFQNYHVIPNTYTKVASYTTPTVTASDAGATVQTKYKINISKTQLAGAYNGKVKYTMVHPNNAPAPSTDPVITNTTCSTRVPGVTYMQELADSTKKSAALSSMTQGSQYYLVDKRDNQGYCVAKQADGNIWMTQNLDLDIGGSGVATLTSENTDLNTSGSAPYVDGYSTSGGVITWSPASTATTSGRTISYITVTGWTNSNNSAPYSAEGGDRYYYTTGTTSDETMQTLAQCTAVSGRSEELCAHYHSGNYYNWTAAIASNASSGIGSTRYDVAANSICPKGWKLPQGRTSTAADPATRQFGNLWYTSGIITSVDGSSYATDGFNKIRTSPLFFVRGGFVGGSSLGNSGNAGGYWSSSVDSASIAYFAFSSRSYIDSANTTDRSSGRSVRCMVR